MKTPVLSSLRAGFAALVFTVCSSGAAAATPPEVVMHVSHPWLLTGQPGWTYTQQNVSALGILASRIYDPQRPATYHATTAQLDAMVDQSILPANDYRFTIEAVGLADAFADNFSGSTPLAAQWTFFGDGGTWVGEKEKARRLIDAGGRIAHINLDDPIRRITSPNNVASSYFTLDSAAAEVAKVIGFWRTYLNAEGMTDAKINLIVNFPNWGWRGEPSYTGVTGSTNGYGDYFVALHKIRLACKNAGVVLDGLVVDNPWDYATGNATKRPAITGYPNAYWMDRMRDLEDTARDSSVTVGGTTYNYPALKFRLVINDEDSGQDPNGAATYVTRTINYVNRYYDALFPNNATISYFPHRTTTEPKVSGRPDGFWVQSWYPEFPKRPSDSQTTAEIAAFRDDCLTEGEPNTFVTLTKAIHATVNTQMQNAVGVYPLNESSGTTAANIGVGGATYDATIHDANMPRITGKSGLALEFRGDTNDYVSVPASAQSAQYLVAEDDGTVNSAGFALSFWVRPDQNITLPAQAATGISRAGQRFAITPNQGLIYRNNPGDAGVGLSVGKNGIVVYEHASNHYAPVLVYSGTVANTSKPWAAITLNHRDRIPQLYVDGVLVKTGVVSAKSCLFPSGNLGAGWDPASAVSGFFNGALDDVRVYARALARTEILMRAGK